LLLSITLVRDTRAVRIYRLTARVLCRGSYRVVEHTTETGSSY